MPLCVLCVCLCCHCAHNSSSLRISTTHLRFLFMCVHICWAQFGRNFHVQTNSWAIIFCHPIVICCSHGLAC